MQSSPHGRLSLPQHWIVTGVPQSGKSTLVRDMVRGVRRLVVFDPKGDYATALRGSRVLEPADLFDRNHLAGRWLRLVLLAGRRDDLTVAEELIYTQRRCREAGRREGLVLVLEELNRYQLQCVESLSNLHANGHGDGLVTIMVAQRAQWIPRGCRATATNVLSLLQDYQADLDELAEDYGQPFADRVRAWVPHSPPVEWSRRPLYAA